MRVTQSFANGVLNSLTTSVAVLDASGCIVAVNDAWKRFASENGANDKTAYLGASYLAVCERAATDEHDVVAQTVLHGIRDLLSGERTGFSVEYPCHSPTAQSWFKLDATRFVDKGAPYVVVVHEDITAQKQAQAALQDTEKTLRGVLEALPVGVWILNQEGQIVHGNFAGQKIWAGARYVGPKQFGEYRGWWLHSGRRIAAEEWAAARAIQKGQTSIDEEIRIECFDGTSKIILNSAIPLRDPDGKITGAVLVNQDITARTAMEQELIEANAEVDAVNRELEEILDREQRMARTDELTGLCNRRQFFDLGTHLFTVAQRYSTPLAVVMFDIDNFKLINDVFGHQAGDTLLTRVAQIARERSRQADVLARYGGEEFILLLPNTGVQDAFAAAEDIRQKVAGCRHEADGQKVRLTVSAGVAEIAPAEDSLERLIHRADLALYAAKSAGRNCSRMFEESWSSAESQS